MNNDVQYLSPFMFAAAILAVLSAAAVIRLISKTFSRRRALWHLRHDSGTDDEGKLLFKQKIRRCYMVEEHRNREKLKRQITKGIMLAQTYQFQKLRHTDITHIIRRTLLNFRYRFFTNLRLALIRKARSKKGGTGGLTHMQQTAIREMMAAMGLKNFKKQNCPAPAEANPEWLAQEARIKEMNIGLERKNLDKPPEIRKAAVRAGYYADDSLKKVIDDS